MAPTPEHAFSVLRAWYEDNARYLPWRHTNDPWAILVCEIMSQQTPVARVEPVWREWMERWPTPRDLAAESPAEVLIAWASMGYPRRALRLQEAAQQITNHGFPTTYEGLLELPGVGQYTAAAVMAFAYTKRSVVLDTNIRRVLARWHGNALPAPSQTKAEFSRAARFVPHDDAASATWNAAIMEFGALVCQARAPLCEQCPLTAQCEWYQAGRPGDTHAHRRRPQKWEGTNRQARGAIMAQLRQAPASYDSLLVATGLEPARFVPALDGLVADGLAERHGDIVRLPLASTP
ncbi:HhH-GPD family protein [Trueperella bialowiezensis]|uniref:Adenine DNA glycosylase n=1 Tax=Trueperella bialowiezensis TaxID=312285 RepID=A0A448PFH5_9ACTO|nr:A/G-specific adenine glycosylase [Trueperella bialowiezensis]VEI13677.1 A/G-specific adenine glycosylase [Trueperella bialowiezensis]